MKSTEEFDLDARRVLVSRGRGRYSTVATFNKEGQAAIHFNALNLRAPYRARVLFNGKVIARKKGL